MISNSTNASKNVELDPQWAQSLRMAETSPLRRSCSAMKACAAYDSRQDQRRAPRLALDPLAFASLSFPFRVEILDAHLSIRRPWSLVVDRPPAGNGRRGFGLGLDAVSRRER